MTVLTVYQLECVHLKYLTVLQNTKNSIMLKQFKQNQNQITDVCFTEKCLTFNTVWFLYKPELGIFGHNETKVKKPLYWGNLKAPSIII